MTTCLGHRLWHRGHRAPAAPPLPPFLLVDRVLAWVPNESITAVKNVSINEPFFQGHFPVLRSCRACSSSKALAQTGGVLIAKSLQEPLATGCSCSRAWKRPGSGGRWCRRTNSSSSARTSSGACTLCKMHAVATVDGKVAAEAELSAAIVDKAGLA